MATRTMADTQARRLALLGGLPAFESPLHVGRPNVGDRQRFLQYVDAILDSRWLSNHGPFVRQFEEELSERLGVRHCLATCNATVGLQIVIRALGLSGEVIVPSFTFVATAHALQWLGITPVFCDIDPSTHNLDPECVERLITPLTTGIIGVHLWGRPCEIDSLQRIADARHLKLVFDAAHALGCSYRGAQIGGFGNAEVFSLHATKFVNSFEGGIVATNDDDLAAQVRLMKDFGFAGYDNVVGVGTNGKMNEISAAMGLTNLECLDEVLRVNARNYHAYEREVDRIPGLSLTRYDESQACNWQYIVVEVDGNLTGLGRDDLIRVLRYENVLARRYFWPGCHRMEPYRSLFPDAHMRLPQTEAVAGRIIVLPTGTAVGEGDIETIGDILRTAIANGPAIRAQIDG